MNRIIPKFLAVILLASLLAGSALAHPPSGIVVDQEGAIYFSDLEQIWKIDAAGTLSIVVAGVHGRHTHQLVMDEAGNLYGEDITYQPADKRWISSIWRITPGGAFTYILPPTSNPPKGLSMFRDREGNTYAVEQNNNLKRETLLLRRSPDGTVTLLAGGSYGHADGRGREAKFKSIGGMAWGADGTLYLTDSGTLRKVTKDGVVTTVARDLDAVSPSLDSREAILPGGLMGLAVDAQHNVYIADFKHRRLLKITPDGKASTVLNMEPPWSPTGVAVADGNLYVLEQGFTLPATYSGPRVRKIASDGKITTLATIGEVKATNAQKISSDINSKTPALPFGGKLTSLITLGFAVLFLSGMTLLAWRVRRQRLESRWH